MNVLNFRNRPEALDDRDIAGAPQTNSKNDFKGKKFLPRPPSGTFLAVAAMRCPGVLGAAVQPDRESFCSVSRGPIEQWQLQPVDFQQAAASNTLQVAAQPRR
jgi:hypothetical protein